MKRLTLIVAALAFATAHPSAQTQSTASPVRSMLDTYCVGCHSATGRAGGIAFAGIQVEDVGANAEIWEKAIRKLRGRQMPPPGSRQPSQADVDSFVHALETSLDSVKAGPVAGHVAIQ